MQFGVGWSDFSILINSKTASVQTIAHEERRNVCSGTFFKIHPLDSAGHRQKMLKNAHFASKITTFQNLTPPCILSTIFEFVGQNYVGMGLLWEVYIYRI